MVNPDFRDLFAALNEARANYLVVGAHAVAFYRIDLTTHIDGVAFEAAWPNRLSTAFGDQSIWIIGRAELIQNKTAAARPQDVLDLAMLEKHGAW